LVTRDSVTLPAGVQYCWPHRNQRYFYVASSSNAAGNLQTGTEHHVTAFTIDPATGALNQIGVRTPAR
jgi:6-phosphogluconolactonase (cycloisomerase 2 family)